MTRAFAKSNRIGQVERLLLASRVPLSQAEIARRCEVHRSTIGRLVQDMVDDGIPVRLTDEGLVYVERTAYISRLHLKLHEATAVFLACRMLARYSDKPNSHTVEALEKLGVSLQSVMPGLGGHIATTSAALRSRLPKQSDDQQRVLERLTEAWATGVKVRLWYHPLKARRAYQHTFAPFFLEPSAIGYGTYVIGVAEPPGKLRTRKLERIERVELTDEPFVVPADFDPNALLAGAWGIWFEAEDQPTTVALRFAAGQASRRMRESHWHPSQRTTLDDEGRLLWSADIDEPQEMLPWIRGWGADCEVLAPAELRERVIGELRRQHTLYGAAQAPDAGPELYAHTPAPGSNEWHPLIEHLTGVAELARGFAEPFGGGALAYQLGLWHDVGKANPAFQAYLKRCHTDPRQKGTGPDHKAAGTLLATRHFRHVALLVQGHHGGLQAAGQLDTWLVEQQRERTADRQQTVVDAAIETVRRLLPTVVPAGTLPFPAFLRDKVTAELFLRMLFSALVDADYLDTEQHWEAGKRALRRVELPLATLLERFEQSQRGLTGQQEGTLSAARHSFYEACCGAAELPPGLFRLAIPTGGGKTRSAMAFALRHAVRHGLQRVIVAVPFISITEQTAEVYRKIFETEADVGRVVLEHHSGIEGRYGEGREYRAADVWARLAAENWDAPVVVTTTVQLFESLFANRTGRCRKLHRLAKSVIILDEVQALPPHLLTPILSVVRELAEHYGATVVLSTATQPAFASLPEFSGGQMRDVVPDAASWFSALARVNYEWPAGAALSWAEVAAQMADAGQALVVVNTKGDALALLNALGDPDALHLSTMLCGAHRRAVIAEVHRRLSAGEPCRLVSTQVIEAGVDLDFPLVLRAVGPLDRIIQAAGRCNREGRAERGRVIVFSPAEGKLPPGSYKTATEVTQAMLREGLLDPDDPAAVARYFQRLFAIVDRDREGVQAFRKEWDYPEVAKRFRMIDEETESVIVQYGDAQAMAAVRDAVAALRAGQAGARQALRRLQPHLVSLRVRDAERYRKEGLIEPLLADNALGVGLWHGQYDAVRGLVADDDRATWVI